MNVRIRQLLLAILSFALGALAMWAWLHRPSAAPPPAAPPAPAVSPPAPPPPPPAEAIFFIDSHDKAHGIFRIYPDGTGRRWLAETRALLHDNQFTVSADGHRIAYLTASGGVGVMDSDGNHAKTIVPSGADYPCINPDGTAVAYTHDRCVYRVDVGGGEPRALTTPGKDDADILPVWRPDGRQIAFIRAARDSDAGGSLMTMHADGTSPRVVAKGAFFGVPQWSPDGRLLCVDATELDDSDGVFVLANPATRRVRTWPQANGPVFSPDGRWVAFHDMRRNQWSVAMMRPDGTERHGVKQTFSMDADPVFSPRGDALLVTRYSEEEPHARLVIVTLTGTRSPLTTGWQARWVVVR